MTAVLNLTLKIWRQSGPTAAGELKTYDVPGISDEMSFLEMLDILNDRLLELGEEPVAFEHDCREGICGSCGLMINGQAHGPQKGTATCQLHMRKFADGDVITVEPWRAAAFPVVKDLVVNRSAFDRIVESGGYISVNAGAAPEANLTPVPKEAADAAFDAAACIGCGACVAACPNGAAQLFTSAKVSHLNLLPQGQAERYTRVEAMVDTMEEFFGSCTNHGECQEACPKSISIDYIALMNRDYVKAKFKNRKLAGQRK
jgi:succinate dehydrogenase / fumarate reductase iron-sulfur subunit